MKAFSQAIFFAFASGLEYKDVLGVSLDEMYSFLAFQFHYRFISHWTARDHFKYANLLYHVMKELEDPSAGVTLFVGHDGDLDALAMYFNLDWSAPPYQGPFP